MVQMVTTTIDGSHGEGGGQILRNACTYAAILGTNVRITNIRAGRKIPGLRPQHLVGLRLLEAASGGCLKEGNHVGSTEILFVGSSGKTDNSSNFSTPKTDSSGGIIREYVGDTQTAGSICLLMQTILPFSLFRVIPNKTNDGGSKNADDSEGTFRFILKGGTDTSFAPSLDYNRFVFLPILRNYVCVGGGDINTNKGNEEFQKAIDLSLVRRGFYPRGGGEVHMTIHQLSNNTFPLPPIRLTKRGDIVGVTVRAFTAGNCPISMANVLSTTVKKILLSNSRYKKVPITIETLGELGGKKRSRTPSSGCGVLITAKTETGCLLGGSSIGSPKIPLEETARIATKEIVEAMDGGGCVDDYLQDQLIIYMALAGGVSEIVTNSLTLHTETAIWLASKMLPSAKFEVTKLKIGENDRCHRIRCHGIGFCAAPNR